MVADHVGVDVLKAENAVIPALFVRHDYLYELNDELAERKQYDR